MICMKLDEILQQHVSWQPQELYWISRSKVRVTGPYFHILYHCEIGQKKFVDVITHELRHSAWWYSAWTLTMSRTVLNFKVKGQASRSHGFFGVFLCSDTVVTRGQYLALSKAWLSCSCMFSAVAGAAAKGPSWSCAGAQLWRLSGYFFYSVTLISSFI